MYTASTVLVILGGVPAAFGLIREGNIVHPVYRTYELKLGNSA